MGCSSSREKEEQWDSPQIIEDSSSPPKTSNKTREKLKIVTENLDKDIRDYYVIQERVLGSGVSGKVRLCTNKLSNIEFAVKTLNKKKYKRDRLNQLREEIKILTLLDHPNIIKLHEFFETQNEIFLIMELCRGGELLDRLHEQKGHSYNEKTACQYIHTILSSIKYCHLKGIVHRDLKLENFLFESESADSQLKLIDFGLSQYLDPNQTLNQAVGTPYYVSPEVLAGRYDSKCDIWSIGVIAYMLLSGTPPFYGDSDAEILLAVKAARWKFDSTLFKPISREAKDFIRLCLIKRPDKRPSAKALLNHPWFGILTKKDNHSVSLNVISKLKDFQNRSAFARLAIEVCAHTLCADQIEDLRNEFSRLDKRKTGEISYSDLQTVLRDQKLFSEEELSNIFEKVDHSKSIKYHEFLAATISQRRVTEENILATFEKMSNHSEFITPSDIKSIVGNDLSVDVDSMLGELNLPVDSHINYDQFKSIVLTGLKSPAALSPNSLKRTKFNFWNDDDVDK